MSDAAFADFTRSFSALSDCKRLSHGISVHCRSAKAVHTRFQRIVGVQKPSTCSFGALSDCKMASTRNFGALSECKKTSTRNFSALLDCKRASTRDFSALSDCKSRPHAVSVHCQTAKAVHTRFQRIVGLQMPIHMQFQRIVGRQTLASMQKGACVWFLQDKNARFYTNRTRRCI